MFFAHPAMNPKLAQWEAGLHALLRDIDHCLEDRHGVQWPLHPARPRRGSAANPQYDGLFRVTAAFSAGYGSRLGPGYVVQVEIVTLSHVPPDVREQIEQEVYKMALAEEVAGVTTSKQTLLPTTTTPDYVQAGVSLSASGDLASVFRWIHSLNRPEDFRVIRNIKVQPDKEKPENIVANFELLRWYAPPEA